MMSSTLTFEDFDVDDDDDDGDSYYLFIILFIYLHGVHGKNSYKREN